MTTTGGEATYPGSTGATTQLVGPTRSIPPRAITANQRFTHAILSSPPRTVCPIPFGTNFVVRLFAVLRLTLPPRGGRVGVGVSAGSARRPPVFPHPSLPPQGGKGSKPLQQIECRTVLRCVSGGGHATSHDERLTEATVTYGYIYPQHIPCQSHGLLPCDAPKGSPAASPRSSSRWLKDTSHTCEGSIQPHSMQILQCVRST
jgi:hypothetical protein